MLKLNCNRPNHSSHPHELELLRLGTWAGLFRLGFIIEFLGLAYPYKINSLIMSLYYTWAFVVVISYGKKYNSHKFCRINSYMRWVICHKYFMFLISYYIC